MSRVLIFLYGALSYAIFLGVFVYSIGFIIGIGTPTALDGPQQSPFWHALAVDLFLLAGFALQHSGMARPAFKNWLTGFVPVAAERSTYVLMSSLLLVALFVFWQPIDIQVWTIQEPLISGFLVGLYFFGWALLFYVTCLIDHFDLFGLRQVWRRLKNERYEPPKFVMPTLYRIVRHPLYVAWLIIFWATPTMSAAHLVFALMTTAYILIAIQLEERDLIAAHPEYAAYRRSTPMLIPRFGAKRQMETRVH